MSHSITIKADYLEKDPENGPVVYQVQSLDSLRIREAELLECRR